MHTVCFLCTHHSSSAVLEGGITINIIIRFWKQNINYAFYIMHLGLRCCTTNRKVAGSIPAGVTGIFH